MHPYIILLLLPLVGIVVFWLLSIPQAILAYVIILIISGLLYWVIARAMRKQPQYGSEGMIGAKAKVVSRLGPQDEAQYLVRVRGELWNANSKDELKPGETVIILSVNGLTLLVGRTNGEPSRLRVNKP
jgi:membrane protein implicated in regulation of membrane protease activity